MKSLSENFTNKCVESSIMYKTSPGIHKDIYLISLINDWTEIEERNEWIVQPSRTKKKVPYSAYNFNESNFNCPELDYEHNDQKYIDKYLFEDIPETNDLPKFEEPSKIVNIELESISEDDSTYDCCSLWSIDESFCICDELIQGGGFESSITEKTVNNTKIESSEQNGVYNEDFRECSSSTWNSSYQSEIASPIFEVISSNHNKTHSEIGKSHRNTNDKILCRGESDGKLSFENNVDNDSLSLPVTSKTTPTEETESIDFNDLDLDADSVRSIEFRNIIDGNSKSGKIKILCQEIISEASSNNQKILLSTKIPDSEKNSTNLIGETKNISEFLCNEVYLNPQLMDDFSMFTDNQSFNREHNLPSPITAAVKLFPECDKSTNKKSILKSRQKEDSINLSNQYKLKKIKKKVSFDEAELVNNVKKRKIFINNDEKVRHKFLNKKKHRKNGTDQVFITTVAMKKNKLRGDNTEDDICSTSKLDGIKRKRKKYINDERRKKGTELIGSKKYKGNGLSRKCIKDHNSSENIQDICENLVTTGKTAISDDKGLKISFSDNKIVSPGDSSRKSRKKIQSHKGDEVQLEVSYDNDNLITQESKQIYEEVDSTSSDNNGIFVLNSGYKSNEASNQVTELEAKVVDKLKNGMAVYKLHKKLPNGEKQVYSDIRYYFNKVFNHLDILTPDLEANYNEGMMEIIVYDNEQFLKQYGDNAGFCVIENYQLVVNSLLPVLIKDNQPKEIVVYDNEGNESMLQLDSLLQAIENHNAKKQSG